MLHITITDTETNETLVDSDTGCIIGAFAYQKTLMEE